MSKPNSARLDAAYTALSRAGEAVPARDLALMLRLDRDRLVRVIRVHNAAYSLRVTADRGVVVKREAA